MRSCPAHVNNSNAECGVLGTDGSCGLEVKQDDARLLSDAARVHEFEPRDSPLFGSSGQCEWECARLSWHMGMGRPDWFCPLGCTSRA